MHHPKQGISGLSVAGLLVTLGIVFGDIGTSPLYVYKAILSGAENITGDFVLGALSCVIWTLTLQTTVKYVIITLRADNNGEGGIFSLFALIRKKARYAYIFAIVGGCALLSDGVITPAVTVVSAIEGLRFINPGIPVIPIVVVIITLLFAAQQFGTNLMGKAFGPIMLGWFTMLGVLGLAQVVTNTSVFAAFNPWYAITFIVNEPNALVLLGAIFLCTTGAEALYSDLGHCGRKNIRVSWTYVKVTLILNYMGQSAWILNGNATFDCNPFFGIMPGWFLLPGVIMATLAAIIASQSLISGSYTLISEAISLNLWPKVQIKYPSEIKGQMYIGSITLFLWVACLFVVFYFQDSSKMEAAYGLAIVMTMLMTTLLLANYLFQKRTPRVLVALFLTVYLTIEFAFLLANGMKFMHGGWFPVMLATILFIIMYSWYQARKIRNRYLKFSDINEYIPIIQDLSQDKSIPKFATNLVLITRADKPNEIEHKNIYSIINKQPKRADVYWLLHIDTLDEPYTMEYKVHHLIPGTLIRIDFNLGFKVAPRINKYFMQIVQEMVEKNEIDHVSRYDSLKKHNVPGDFKFVIITRLPNYDTEFPFMDGLIMDLYEVIKHIGITEVKALGLDTNNVVSETVPLVVSTKTDAKLKRVP